MMRLTLFPMLAFALLAQIPATAALQPGVTLTESAAASEASQLRGRIVAGKSSEPLHDVKVLLRESGTGIFRGSGTTNTSGQFQIPKVRPGQYQLQIYCSDAGTGQPLDEYYLPPQIGPFTITRGKDAQLEIQISKGFNLSGQVIAQGIKVSPRSPLYKRKDEIVVLGGQVSSEFAVTPKRIEFSPGPFAIKGLNPKATSLLMDVSVSGVRPFCRVEVTGGPFESIGQAALAKPIQFPTIKNLTFVVWDRPEQTTRDGVWVEVRGTDNPFHRYVNAMDVRNDPWPIGKYGLHVRYNDKISPAFMYIYLSTSKRRPGVFQLDYPKYAKAKARFMRELDSKSNLDAENYVEMKIPIKTDGAAAPTPPPAPTPAPVPGPAPKAPTS